MSTTKLKQMRQKEKELVRQYWDDMPCGTGNITYPEGSLEYFEAIAEKRNRLEPFITDYAQFEKWAGKKVLEIGCGVGSDLLRFAQAGAHVVGIDLSPKSVFLARSRLQVHNCQGNVLVADAENLPYSDGYFDKVVCSSSLEHFPDDIESLREMNRVLKSGGTLVLTTDSFLYLNQGKIGERHRKIAHVVNYYTPEILKERLEIASLVMVRSKYLLKSPITRFFSNLGIKMAWRGYLWWGISLLAYPLCLLSERLFRAREPGYTLMAEVKKRG
jgi:SAM-dependent methyltransferase